MNKKDLRDIIKTYLNKISIERFDTPIFQYIVGQEEKAYALSHKLISAKVNHTIKFEVDTHYNHGTRSYIDLEFKEYAYEVKKELKRINNINYEFDSSIKIINPDNLNNKISTYGRAMIMDVINLCLNDHISYEEFLCCKFFGIVDDGQDVFSIIKELLQFKDHKEGDEMRDAVVMWKMAR